MFPGLRVSNYSMMVCSNPVMNVQSKFKTGFIFSEDWTILNGDRIMKEHTTLEACVLAQATEVESAPSASCRNT
jgi:hypothetical protein